jgi:hypothetical protein
MVRTITTQEKIAAQWRAAWALLPADWQRAIADFCLQNDRDLAVAAMKIRSV